MVALWRNGYWRHFPGISDGLSAWFLYVLIRTDAQRQAYATILSFLNDLHTLILPDGVQAYTVHFDIPAMETMMQQTTQSLADIDAFIQGNQQMLQTYLVFNQSGAYRQSPAYQMQQLLRNFTQMRGYKDIFLPAMRTLTPAYDACCQQL